MYFVIAFIALGGSLGAQVTPDAMTRTADSVRPGSIRGTVVFRQDAADHSEVAPLPVTGTAKWRLELDSLDWRRKLTLRFVLSGPAQAEYVIRTAGPGVPRGVLRVKNNPSSHVDPRYYTATMSVREQGNRRVYDYWALTMDTVAFERVDSAASGAILRGTIHLMGFHGFGAARRPGEQTTRQLDATFAAGFDPRPAPMPRTMTHDVQGRIMYDALNDFAVGFMDGVIKPSATDSTKDNARARAYLVSRWGEAAMVDSVATGPADFYVRMRGRYAPVTCIVTYHASAPSCTSSRWRSWSRPGK